MKNQQSETEIRNIIDQRVTAVINRDIKGATEYYAPDLVLFDVVGPLQHDKPGSVKGRLKEWFATFDESEPVLFEMAELRITADDGLASSHSLNHINAVLKDGNKLNMWWRETQHWIKVNENWLVSHSHSSVPFNPKTGKSCLDLKPGQTEVPQSVSPDLAELAKDMLNAYQTKNQQVVENLLHEDFAFTSPQDDHINKAEYFKRCWPFSEQDPVYSYLKIVPNGNTVFLLYNCKTKTGKRFRNTELISFKDDKIIEVEVFFGRDLK